jgi:riboflavin transporter 2
MVKDGTSTVTFLPYISERFGKEYIIANYIGESFSALIPSIIALIQGIGNEMGCVNETLSLNLSANISNGFETVGLKPVPLRPRFSVSVYFIIISIILFTSCLSFLFIDCSKYVRKFYKPQSPIRSSQVTYQDNEKHQMESSLDSPQVSNAYEKPILFSIVTCITFFFYGFLPSIQSYSTLPYGNTAFYLAINLSTLSKSIKLYQN